MNDKRNTLEVHQLSNGLGLQNNLKPEVVVLERGVYCVIHSVNVHITAYKTVSSNPSFWLVKSCALFRIRIRMGLFALNVCTYKEFTLAGWCKHITYSI